MPRFIPGIAAGALADIFLEDNERVTKSTDETLNTLAQLVIEGVKKRRKKLDSVEESMSRLEALGFKRPVAASIARGGLYAVNDAVTAAGKARDFGEDVNSYYVTQAKYSPDEFANYTRAEMAEAIVPVSNIKESADILTKGKRINTERVNEAVGKYVGATPEASSIDVPVFAQDVSKMGGGKFSLTASSAAATFLDKMVRQAKAGAAEADSGLSVKGYDSSGRAIYGMANRETYAKWLKKTIPQLIKSKKDTLKTRDFALLESAGTAYLTDELGSLSIDKDNPFSLDKAIPKDKSLTVEITPEDQKINRIANQLRKGSTPETIKNQIKSLYPQLPEDRINTLIEEGQKRINMEKFPDYGAPNVG